MELLALGPFPKPGSHSTCCRFEISVPGHTLQSIVITVLIFSTVFILLTVHFYRQMRSSLAKVTIHKPNFYLGLFIL